MNRLLKELETQLRVMNETNRANVIQGIRSIIVGFLKLRESGLQISKMATSKAAGSLMISMASETTIPQLLEEMKAIAKETGPHVHALFHSI